MIVAWDRDDDEGFWTVITTAKGLHFHSERRRLSEAKQAVLPFRTQGSSTREVHLVSRRFLKTGYTRPPVNPKSFPARDHNRMSPFSWLISASPWPGMWLLQRHRDGVETPRCFAEPQGWRTGFHPIRGVFAFIRALPFLPARGGEAGLWQSLTAQQGDARGERRWYKEHLGLSWDLGKA